MQEVLSFFTNLNKKMHTYYIIIITNRHCTVCLIWHSEFIILEKYSLYKYSIFLFNMACYTSLYSVVWASYSGGQSCEVLIQNSAFSIPKSWYFSETISVLVPTSYWYIEDTSVVTKTCKEILFRLKPISQIIFSCPIQQ